MDVDCLKITEDKSSDNKVHASDTRLIKATRAKPRSRARSSLSTPLQCQDAELNARISTPLQCSGIKLEARLSNAKLEARV